MNALTIKNDDDTAKQIAFVVERIADECYDVRPPPSPWAGRTDIIAETADRFHLDVPAAAQVVDAAVTELYAPSDYMDRAAAKRLMRRRLECVRGLIVNAIAKGREEKTYKYLELPLRPFKRIPFKRKIYRETPASLLALLISVERAIAKLDGLDGVDLSDGAASVIEELDRAIGEADQEMPGVRRKITTSLSQRIKVEQITELTPRGLEAVRAAMKEKAALPAE